MSNSAVSSSHRDSSDNHWPERHTSFDHHAWRDLYVAALLEGDEYRVPERISVAERAIVDRSRELFAATGDHIEEEEALDDALYALHALKSCLAVHGRFAEAA
jgi:hypothetical protein